MAPRNQRKNQRFTAGHRSRTASVATKGSVRLPRMSRASTRVRSRDQYSRGISAPTRWISLRADSRKGSVTRCILSLTAPTRGSQVLPVADLLHHVLNLSVFLDHAEQILGLHEARVLTPPLAARLLFQGALDDLVQEILPPTESDLFGALRGPFHMPPPAPPIP